MKQKNKDRIKRICFVAPNGFALYHNRCKVVFGGAEVQMYLLSKEYAKNKDFSVNVITGDFKAKINNIKLYKNIKIHISIPLGKKIRNHFFRPFSILVSLFKINPEIVIQMNSGITTGLCALYCKIFKKKFVFLLAHKVDVNGDAEKNLIGKIFKFGIDNATYIVAQNQDQIFDLQHYKRRKFDNIEIIKNGYELTNQKKKNKKFILWVARGDNWKRPELYLKLAQRFPQEKFVMICPQGKDRLLWDKIYTSSKKIKNLTFLQFVPFVEIDRFFRDATVFVNTSEYEGFPNTFIQALKNKVPILSLKTNPDNFISQYKCGFHCDDDFEKLAYSLNELLSNHELYDTYSNNGFEYVKNHHDIKKLSKKWIELMKKVVNYS